MSRFVLGLAMAASVGCAASAQTPPPASAFGRLPAVTQAVISPNGQGIAILGGGAQGRTLSFTVIDQPGVNVLRLGDVETMEAFWINDSYALAHYAIWEKVGPRNAYRFERNVAVTPDAKVASYLLKSDTASSLLVQQPVMGLVDGPPPRVLVRGLTVASGPERDANTRLGRKGADGNPLVAAMLSVDPATGRGVEVERGDFDTEGWDVDLTGKARVKIDVDELTGKYRLFGRPKGVNNRWDLIQNGKDDNSDDYLGYSDPEDAIYLARQTPAGVQILRRRLADGREEPVGAAVKGGNPWLKWDNHTGGVLGIGQNGEGGKIEWLTPDFGTPATTLGRAFKGKSVSIRSWSRDRSRMIVRVEGPDAPAAWYIYDKPRKELSPIGETYPELAGQDLGRTSWMTYKARDGLEIPAYLTLPANAPAANAKLPLVVLPHGGPSARDDEGFDYIVHFLTSRGYAVLRPQYRGSYGFGPEFEKAGDGEWGGKMQTDLLDGVQALAAQGVIDARRVCIVGSSFGGFSALSGAVFHPQAYRCAASIAGVSDLGQLLGDNMSSYGRTSKSFRSLRQQLSTAAGGKLEAVSPLRNADKAAIPILLLHGAEDTIVSPTHSKRMADALVKAGKPVEHVVLADDNHYLTKAASRTQVLQSLEAFLAKNLPVSQVQAAR